MTVCGIFQARGQHAEALAALESPLGSAMTLANEREQLRAELTVRAWSTPSTSILSSAMSQAMFESDVPFVQTARYASVTTLVSPCPYFARIAGGNGLHGQGGWALARHLGEQSG